MRVSADRALEMLTEHYDHEVVIARYCVFTNAVEETVLNYALECLECDQVLFDADTK
jgi:hypothetical protein